MDEIKEKGKQLTQLVKEDFDKILSIKRLLKKGAIPFITLTHVLASLIIWVVVMLNPFPYPLMYHLMTVLLTFVLAMKFLADYGGRKKSSWLLLFANLILIAFWVIVILDQIPQRSIVLHGLVYREDLPNLYFSVILYLISAVGLVVDSFLKISQRSK